MCEQEVNFHTKTYLELAVEYNELSDQEIQENKDFKTWWHN